MDLSVYIRTPVFSFLFQFLSFSVIFYLFFVVVYFVCLFFWRTKVYSWYLLFVDIYVELASYTVYLWTIIVCFAYLKIVDCNILTINRRRIFCQQITRFSIILIFYEIPLVSCIIIFLYLPNKFSKLNPKCRYTHIASVLNQSCYNL